MDFQVALSAVPVVQEFTAIVLAGFGNELVPLSSDNGDESSPKALLPIGNRPMIDYPLTWLEQSGVRDVLLICPSSHRKAISHHINSDTTASSFSSLRIDLQTYDETTDTPAGTAALLRHFTNRIPHNFIILPCDFVPPSAIPLARVINKFRTESATDGAIASSFWFERVSSDKPTGAEEWDGQPPPPAIVWDAASGTLLYVDTEEDLDRDHEDFEFRTSLLTKYPQTRFSSKFQDAHVYVCKRTVLDVLAQKPQFESFREEFLPWLCKSQYQKTKREKYGRVLAGVTQQASQTVALSHSTLHISPAIQSGSFGTGDSSPEEDDTHPSPLTRDSLRVGITVHRLQDGACARVNDLHTFLEANRRIVGAPEYAYTLPSDPVQRALVDAKANISPDSMIGDSSRIAERTTIKRTVIGRHCVIGKMAKLVGCVLLDHCVVEDGAKLDNCILGRNTKIGAKAELSKCVTQGGYEVDSGATIKNEKLEVSDWAAPSVDESISDVGADSDGNGD